MIEQKVLNILCNYNGLNKSEVHLEDTFDDLYMDSLDFIEIIMKCENEFNISIPDEACIKIKKVQDLVNYIKEHVK